MLIKLKQLFCSHNWSILQLVKEETITFTKVSIFRSFCLKCNKERISHRLEDLLTEKSTSN